MRLRQVSLMTPSLWQAEREVIAQLDVTIVNRDRVQELALKNAVFAVGDTFLEILEPTLPDVPGQRFLEQRGGAGGYMACIHVEDIDRAVARATELGIRIVLKLDRLSYNEVIISSAHLHPGDTGGTFFSFEQPTPHDCWAWGGLAWPHHRHEETVQQIAGVVIATRDPARLSARLTAFLDAEAGDTVLHLSGGGTITLVHDPQAERDGMTGVDLLATDRSRVGEEHQIAGTTMRFV